MPDRPHPYDQPSDPAKRISATLTDGPDRAPARAMLKAIGFTDEDLARPIVGVATTWIETMPCNYNQRRLAESVKQGIRAAGGTPMEFNTISISDGVTMGTQGMKDSLVSREVFEAVGAYRAGKITLDELYEVENVSCPGPGACGGQFTANTMSTVMEFMGLSPGGLNGIPAEDPAKDEAARRCGELVMDLVRRDVRPSAIVDRRSIENAIASVAATGGSTNGVLHLLAIAREFGVPLSIDEFGTIADRTPIVADMMPGGRYAASDMYD